MNRLSGRTFAGASIAGIAMCCGAPMAVAQGGGAAIEEIIITAERRAESIQKVPLAVSAFGAEELRERLIVNLDSVAVRTPSLVYDEQDAAEPNIYLRGIGNQNGSDAANESPIAFYVDDVYVGRTAGTSTDLFDLERVEVLRGPQGTLFGRNASGGVIHVITQKPQDEFGARLRVGVGNKGQRELSGMVTGPLSDTVSYKLVGMGRDRDGWVKNLTTGNDVSQRDSVAFRGALRFRPSEKLEVLLAGDYLNESGNSSAHDTDYQTDASVKASDPRPRRINALTDGNHDREIAGIQLRFDYDMDWATLTSISAYRELDYEGDWYFAGNPLTDDTIESFNFIAEESDQISQEIRLTGSSGKLDWVTGLYYYKVDVEKSEGFDQWFHGLFKALGLPQSLWGLGDGLALFEGDATTKSWAVFAQGTYALTDRLSFTAGVRYTKDKRSLDNEASILRGVRPVGLNENYTVDLGKSWERVTPRFALEYQFSDDVLGYVSATSGFKSGVFAGTASTRNEALVPLKPERAWNYETGIKSQWLEDRLRLNVAAFYMDFKDLQIGTLIPGQAIIVEQAPAEIQGFEIEMNAVPVDGLSLIANYAYLDAEITGGANDGNRLPRAPKNKLNLAAALTLPLGEAGEVTARVDWTHQSKFYHEPDNRTTEILDSYSLIDASLVYRPAKGNWSLSLWGKNLDDKLVEKSMVAVAVMGQNYVTYGPPRTYGATFSWEM